MKKILLALAVLVGLGGLFTGSALALEVKSGENILLERATPFGGSLAVFGNSLIIESDIDGDLICAGRKIEIKSKIDGDVLCAGQSIKITGQVTGDVRVAGQMVILEGIVGKNVNVFAQEVIIGKKAVIGGELYTAGSDVTFEGQLKRGWMANAESINVDGTVGDDAQLTTGALRMGPMAYMMGRLDYVSNQEAVVANGARMMGGYFRTAPKTDEDRPWGDSARRSFWKMPSTMVNGFATTGKIVGKLMMGIFGLIMVWLFPTWLKKSSEIVEKQMGESALWGLGILVLSPIVIMLTMMSIVGIPLAMLMIPILVLLVAAAHVVAAGFIGAKLAPKKTKLVWSWLLGYAVLAIVGWLPVIGGLVYLLATIVGLGAIKLTVSKAKKK